MKFNTDEYIMSQISSYDLRVLDFFFPSENIHSRVCYKNPKERQLEPTTEQLEPTTEQLTDNKTTTVKKEPIKPTPGQLTETRTPQRKHLQTNL